MEINLDDFETIRPGATNTVLPKDILAVREGSLSLGPDIIKRFRTNPSTNSIYIELAYSPKAEAFLLKEDTGNGICFTIDPKTGRARTQHLPYHLKMLNPKKGEYKPHKDNENVFEFAKSTIGNRHTPKVEGRYFIEDYHPKEGDIVSWPFRRPGQSIYEMATGKVSKVWLKTNDDQTQKEYCTIKPISKNWSDYFASRVTSVNVSTKNVIFRER